MARVIYVDSGFLIALIDPTDAANAQSFRLLDQFYPDVQTQLVTTRDAMNEVLAHFSRSLPRTKLRAATLVRDLFKDPKYRVIVVDNPRYLEALSLYESRLDKRYSMVDCIGMTIMGAESSLEVLATDRDFEQEGFTNLMRQSSM